jgi:hypothetical protein
MSCDGAAPDNQGKPVNIHAPKAALDKTNNIPMMTTNMIIRRSS